MPRISTLLALAALFVAAGCSSPPPPEDPARIPPAETPRATPSPDRVSGVGTITYFDLEGGFYGLLADDGSRFDPMNLDEAFRQDGLRVRFRARLRTGVMTIRQWGQPVEILEMIRLDDNDQ